MKSPVCIAGTITGGDCNYNVVEYLKGSFFKHRNQHLKMVPLIHIQPFPGCGLPISINHRFAPVAIHI
jgi:hypothetical protein